MLSDISPNGSLDDKQMRDALAEANVPALLMVLFQLTGDERWLDEPYRPTQTRGLDDHASGGLPESVQQTIREAAAGAIKDWEARRPAAIPAPDKSHLAYMMSVCMGEPVPDEYARMISAEFGYAQRDHRRKLPASGPNDATGFSVIIIGAGISGLAAAARLKEAGIPYTVLEKNQQVGGVWLENQYPGCGVDTPSYLYSFSFFRRNWSTHFGKRDEVKSYIEAMAEEFGLLPRIRLGTEVLAAAYDESNQRWRVRVREGDGGERELSASAVISAVGLFNTPKVPPIPGMDTFGGHIFHSARWPEDLDITGKRVAVVGTGASAMQIVPAIVDQAAHLSVFQRSAQWVAPSSKYFERVSTSVHWLMENVPFYHQWYRFRLAWIWNDKIHASLQIDPDWPDPERSLNAINDGHRRFFTRYLLEQLEGREDLQRKALPSYPPFGKRILLDNGWFAALRHPHVDLVTDTVGEVTEQGLRTASGEEFDADVIVLCTGFEAQRSVQTVDIRGRSGQSLREAWGDDNAAAYLGIVTPDFPNLFFMYGPNTNPGGGSVIHIAECQINYIVELISSMIDTDTGAAEVRSEIHDEYNRRVDEAHSRMVWSHPGMDTYYRNSRGRVVTNMPWRVVDYWSLTRCADLGDFLLEPAAEPDAQRQKKRQER